MREVLQAPEVSVCVPTYNGAKFLEETLESIASQKDIEMEIIVLDDCSSDSSLKIARSVARRHPDCHWVIEANSHRLGMAQNWNACIGLARGEFIKLAGQDDLLLPGCLSAQAHVLRAHPNVSLASTSRTLINGKGRHLFRIPAPFEEGCTEGALAARRCLQGCTNVIGDPIAVLFRREALARVGAFSPATKYCTDIDLWLRLLSIGDLFYQKQSLVLYRIHAGACTTQARAIASTEFLETLTSVQSMFSWNITANQKRFITFKSALLSFIRNGLYRLANL